MWGKKSGFVVSEFYIWSADVKNAKITPTKLISTHFVLSWFRIAEIASQMVKSTPYPFFRTNTVIISSKLKEICVSKLAGSHTDYGGPMKSFFIKITNFWDWADNFGAFGVFWADLSAPILVQWVPCPCFPLINHYFYKKLSLLFYPLDSRNTKN